METLDDWLKLEFNLGWKGIMRPGPGVRNSSIHVDVNIVNGLVNIDAFLEVENYKI